MKLYLFLLVAILISCGKNPENSPNPINPKTPPPSPFEITKVGSDIKIKIVSGGLLQGKVVTPILISGKVNYSAAEKFCQTLNYAGITAWEIPTTADLYELNKFNYFTLSFPETPSFNGMVWAQEGIEPTYRIRNYFIGTTLLFAADLDITYHYFKMTAEGSEQSGLAAKDVLTGTGINESSALKDAKERYLALPVTTKEDYTKAISFKALCLSAN